MRVQKKLSQKQEKSQIKIEKIKKKGKFVNIKYRCLINKKYGLNDNDIPENLVIPNVIFAVERPDNKNKILMIYEEERKEELLGSSGKKYMEKTAAKALESLFKRAVKEGIYLIAISGFRSYERQRELFNASVSKNGEDYANRYSAKAGHSEHQTGLAMDVSAKCINYELEESFGDTKEGQWLKVNAKKEGFIIRYPKGKEEITGYAYEPWHIRYVGKEEAKIMEEQNLVLEEWHEQGWEKYYFE